MAYYLDEINSRAKADPEAFIEECDEVYRKKVDLAADMIIKNLPHSPIVLLSGPSGSGKTTTAMKLEEELKKRGVGTHSVAMDNYFLTRTSDNMPRSPDGSVDLESPGCMDMDLLNLHFTMLSKGESVLIPRFEFSRQIRVLEGSKTLRLRKDEIAIFEGIHALNDDITNVHPEAFKLYLSARSDVTGGDNKLCFKGTWMRLVRRCVRDNLYRGMNVNLTLGLWANVRRGEKLYISPFKDKANLKFDSSFPYEVPVFKTLAPDLFAKVPEGTERFEELRSIIPAFELFEEIDPALLKPDSLLREFIGGGIYEY